MLFPHLLFFILAIAADTFKQNVFICIHNESQKTLMLDDRLALSLDAYPGRPLFLVEPSGYNGDSPGEREPSNLYLKNKR